MTLAVGDETIPPPAINSVPFHLGSAEEVKNGPFPLPQEGEGARFIQHVLYGGKGIY